MPCGRPVSAASICPVWLQSSSIACLPRMTSPGCSAATTPFNSLATASGSTIPSTVMRMPRSAPIASAVRMVSAACAGPIETTTTSVALPASFCRKRLLDGDFVERVHRHLDVGEFDARPVGLDADFHVVVDNPLDGHENFHVGSKLRARRDGAAKAVAAAREPLIGGKRQVNAAKARRHSVGLRAAQRSEHAARCAGTRSSSSE